ncbi:MAG: nucleotidyl transferase AbiEii/AbiGii toxin family protein [Saprospiraceae bacterium]|nr:nucleotidyl transferase AbiEii/AbiGii toxin family protein [Saprospiraceae bacterium]
MLSVNEISQYYPEHLRVFKRFILREYLQYKILEIIFNGPYAEKLVFLCGTCLRLIHQNQRFSEDLDFDNFDLHFNEFDEISKNIRTELEFAGYKIETNQVAKGAYHCYIRFPMLLFEQGLSGYTEEKILIQLDTEPQHFNFKPDQPILNKFDVFTRIFATPPDLLMSQKCFAILNRSRNKGRDFFDLIFLMGRGIYPNMEYLNQKYGINTPDELKARLLDKFQTLNMDEMAKDVAPFLFKPVDQNKIRLFADYLKEYSFVK